MVVREPTTVPLLVVITYLSGSMPSLIWGGSPNRTRVGAGRRWRRVEWRTLVAGTLDTWRPLSDVESFSFA